MRNRISWRAVMREMPAAAIGAFIALCVVASVFAVMLAIAEVVS